MSTYTPQPGTIPARVIEYLKTQPVGFTASSAEISEAIGQDSALNLAAFVSTAERHGALHRHRKPGTRIVFWGLSAAAPATTPKDNKMFEAMVKGGFVREPDQPIAQPTGTLTPVPPVERPQAQPKAQADGPFAVTADLKGFITVTNERAEIILTQAQAQLVVRVANAIGIAA